MYVIVHIIDHGLRTATENALQQLSLYFRLARNRRTFFWYDFDVVSHVFFRFFSSVVVVFITRTIFSLAHRVSHCQSRAVYVMYVTRDVRDRYEIHVTDDGGGVAPYNTTTNSSSSKCAFRVISLKRHRAIRRAGR